MPDSMSAERRALMLAYGAELVLTPGAKGMAGAIEAAGAIAEKEGAFLAGQFSNPANPAAHYAGTGPEIWRDTCGEVAAFVAVSYTHLDVYKRQVKGGAKIIVCPGFLFEEPVNIAMETYPEVQFIAIDCVLTEPTENAIGITYAEDQVGFLAGYAAVKDGMTNLGYMGGMAVPAVQKYGYGFLQGAEYAAQEMGLGEGLSLIHI